MNVLTWHVKRIDQVQENISTPTKQTSPIKFTIGYLFGVKNIGTFFYSSGQSWR